MIDFPPPGALAAVVVAGLLAGLVRGFTGFGAALVFIPVASAALGPIVAVPVLFVVDALVTLPMLPPAFRICRWREVALLVGGAAVTTPVGVRLLATMDPDVVRWIISVAILVTVAAMARGWRYEAAPRAVPTLAVGGLAGFAGGMTSLYGPPVILFWLGGRSEAAVVRANIFAFFGLLMLVTGLALWWNELFTARVAGAAAATIPAYALTLWLGARRFHLATQGLFRNIALALCAAAALAGLPLWF